MIDRLAGEFDFLSNFFIEPDGTCVEIEYQAAKADNEVERRWVQLSATPQAAKKRGRKVRIRPDWGECKIEIMRALVRRKFRDHPELAARLLNTGDEYIEEGNWWGDTFWGVCNGIGENHLGKILMQIRSELSGILDTAGRC